MFRSLSWHRVEPGLSGAEVWRGEAGGRALYALKAWPDGFSGSRLQQIHFWMSRAAHLPFVPDVIRAGGGSSVVAAAGRLWDATRWMTGSQREFPSAAEIEAACAAVARLHAVWRTGQRGPSAGIRNRLQLLRDWLAAPEATLRALAHLIQPGVPQGHAASILNRVVPKAINSLEPWEHASLELQPCVRDLRGEHVLFEDHGVSGIIDYGAMAEDHPALDLARLLGDFAWDNRFHFTVGLSSYRQSGGVLDTPDQFVVELARASLAGSAVMWLRRLSRPGARSILNERVRARFILLIERIERLEAIP